jgi:DNA-binding NarL/FixJ family response regulator
MRDDPSQTKHVALTLHADQPLQTVLDQRTHVLVVEDNTFVRAGIVSLLNRQNDLTCCGEADSIASTPSLVAEKKPDLVLLDLRLKDGESFKLIKELKAVSPHTPILVLSQGDEALYAKRVLRAGASGYIMKQEAPAELLNAIRSVLRGKCYVSAAIAARLQPELYPKPS